MTRFHFLALLSVATVSALLTAPQLAAYTCSETQECDEGCCRLGPDGTGNCGLGPTFCGEGNCTSTCNRKSECNPGWGTEWSVRDKCLLNVCCSEFGYCGTTKDFCGDKVVPKPSCSGRSSDARTIGYYEGWNLDRSCATMEPEDIPLGYYTHLNFAFVLVDPDTFDIAPMDASVAKLYDRVTSLKARQPDLKVWISVGGWSMNDPGKYQTTFSDLAASESAQERFFESLISFMRQHNFDGVDVDWEYPVAEDRGGVPEDYDNFVSLLANLRRALDKSGLPERPGLSITIPSSYWYMRHFDLVKMDPILDFFNVMTYDIHGVWDSDIPSLGPQVQAHTNLTEIDRALELLWRNHIHPSRVLLGLGFYGRSFTLEDPSCKAPGCPFSGGGAKGPCTNTSGTLSAVEIRTVIENGATVTFDEVAAAKIVTWDDDQWVSYDDAETMKLKVDYANRLCLGGTLVWAVDLDNGTSINDLGEDLSRPPAHLVEEWILDPNVGMTDLGTDPVE